MDSILDPIFRKAVDDGEVPGVCAIALDSTGKVLYEAGFHGTEFEVTTRTPLNMYSCTKLMTSVAALQLVENGSLDIHAPVAKYCPEIAQVQVLEGFQDDGSPILRKPAKDILVLHLFTHTAGFAYDFFEADTLKYRLTTSHPPGRTMTADNKEYYSTPLLHEPGSAYVYGTNTDWLGFVVESIVGTSLSSYIDKHIIHPLGLSRTGGTLTAEESGNLFKLHVKDASGKLGPGPPLRDPTAPLALPGGGDYLYSTVEDYTQFLLVLVNGGKHPISGVTILKPETVQKYLFTDMLPTVGCSNAGVGRVVASIPMVSAEGHFLPGVDKGWSLGLMMNKEALPNGRSEGSGAWAGLGNLYYWVDPAAGKLGMVASSYFPFFDRSALRLADALERAVYGKPMADEHDTGSNFKCGLTDGVERASL
ncbi:hypothetical protein LTR56_026081 [Elasticomyces elasticus]|nr:hypothetical protein LTR56_026081 [Elasticomyces elasticus]KAK3652833.1 hypothetical protein LTR22_011497 [Elasticomyces elasticus]KAK4915913.1 hypothetical protein LTR49_016059 [Elasticomyces elasticus]KAK5755359.1 hypothetical protein LTS12_014588 [Elasticomyces elasticus]